MEAWHFLGHLCAPQFSVASLLLASVRPLRHGYKLQHVPGCNAVPIRHHCLKDLWLADGLPVVGVPRADNGKTCMNAICCNKHREELLPLLSTLPGPHERLGVADDDHAIPSPREQYVHPLRRKQKANIVFGIAARQGNDDNIGLFTLIVIC